MVLHPVHRDEPRGGVSEDLPPGCVQHHGLREGCEGGLRFNRRAARNSLVQLRDRRGALSAARGNGKRTMVSLSVRKPRGTVYAFVIKGLRTT